MFDGKVIYEKRFTPTDELIAKLALGEMEPDMEDEGTEDAIISYEEIVEEEARLDCMEERNISYHKAVAEITKNSTYLPMPNRQVSLDEFIQLAIHISEKALMDLKIVQGKYSTEAVFRADWLQETLQLRPLFALADDFRFMPQGDGQWSMNITFAYYTHIVLNRGKLFRPGF